MEDGSSIQNVLDQLVEINQQPINIKEEMVELSQTTSAESAVETTSKTEPKDQQSPSKKKPFKPKVFSLVLLDLD